MSTLEVVPIPLFTDNYAYFIVDSASRKCGVVDPAEPAKVVDALKNHGLELACVLTTHNHWDHAGGNSEIAALYPDIPIYGGKGDAAQAVTHEVGDGDLIMIGSVPVHVLFTPCHTSGHVCYLADDTAGPSAVFTGDTLFVGGCGNFNAGTPSQMHAAFARLAALPPQTLVYVGHEYTVSNLKFAAVVEPGSSAVRERLAWAEATRAQGRFTVPSTIAYEQCTNPFMRTRESAVAAYAQRSDPVDVIGEIRRLKTEWGRKK